MRTHPSSRSAPHPLPNLLSPVHQLSHARTKMKHYTHEKGWLRVVGLIRRACGGGEEDDSSRGDGGAEGTAARSGSDGSRRRPPPPRLAFDLALQVCVLCERPDAGLEVLSLMRSTGLRANLEAYKVKHAALLCSAGHLSDFATSMMCVRVCGLLSLLKRLLFF